ncbi:hypothetical protein ILUMI_14563, partial [Ignelater luminosus]
IKPCELVLKKDYEKVPYQLLPLLEDELKRMVNDGIISKITEPTEFVNPIVLVRKPNIKLRICLDPAVLNKAIGREYQTNLCLRAFTFSGYVSKFIPNLSQPTFNLRQLSKKHAEWLWTDQHQSEFNHLKVLLANVPNLQNQELVIPKSMRPQMIHRLHCNHMGITETQLKANELIFWPNKEIADIVRNCLACLTFENLNQRGPLTIKDIPTSP